MIQEICLVPKKIIDDVVKKSIINSSNSVSILKRENIVNSLNSKPDLEVNIKKIFNNNKQKFDKAIEAYSWILNNVPGIDISINGQVINPMKSINILDFLKDIYPGAKNISREKIQLY